MRKHSSYLRLHLLPITGLIFFWFLYFFRIIVFEEVFYLGDNQVVNIPYISFIITSLKNGEFPLWNPYILAGVPFFLPSNIYIFPLVVLFLILSPETAMSWNIISLVLLAGLGMYFFSFAISKNKTIAFFSGLVYMFSGMLAKNLVSFLIPLNFVYFPLILLCIEKALEKRRIVYCFFAGFFLSLDIFSGHPMLVYISLLSLGIYALIKKGVAVFQKISYLILTLLIMSGLSFVLLLPSVKSTTDITRPLGDFSYATSSSLPLRGLLTIIFPHFFGITETELAGNAGNVVYLGILPLVFLIIAVASGVFKQYKTITLLGLIGLLLSFGKYLPLYKLALFLPFLGSFRQPSYFLFLYVFAGSFLAGIGVNYFLEKFTYFKQIFPRRYKNWCRIVLMSIFILSLFFYLLLNFAPLSTWENIIKLISFFFPLKSLPQLIDKLDKIKLISLTSIQNILCFITIIYISCEFFLKINSRKLALIFISVTVFLDLFFINQPILFTTNRKIYQTIYSSQKIPEILKDQNYRLASILFPTIQKWKDFNRDNFLFTRIRETERIINPNRNMLNNVYSIFGCSTLIPSSYDTMLTGGQNTHLSCLLSSDVSYLDDSLAQAGTRYLLSNKPLNNLPTPRYKMINYQPNNFYLYEDNFSRRRTFLVNEKGEETGYATITGSTPNTVTIATYSDVSSSLILLDNYYPDWKAFVDGQKVTITPFENTFRQVPLSPGTHTTVFRYQPKSFYIGLIISVITLFFSLILILIPRFKRAF